MCKPIKFHYCLEKRIICLSSQDHHEIEMFLSFVDALDDEKWVRSVPRYYDCEILFMHISEMMIENFDVTTQKRIKIN